jgi:hypothetical protein
MRKRRAAASAQTERALEHEENGSEPTLTAGPAYEKQTDDGDAKELTS